MLLICGNRACCVCVSCRFAKVVSDAYLIDIVWRVSISMVAEGTLFNGKLPSTMDKDTFVALIGCIADSKYVEEAMILFCTSIISTGVMLKVKHYMISLQFKCLQKT